MAVIKLKRNIKLIVFQFIIMLTGSSSVYSQNVLDTLITNDTIVYLNLKKKQNEITIFPDTSILFRWQEPNIFTITSNNPEIPISLVTGLNMEIKKINALTYELKPLYSDTLNYQGGKLYIFCKNAEGKNELHTVKEYKFAYPEMPQITISDVPNNFVIDREKLIFSYLKATHKGILAKVLSYKLKYTENQKEHIMEETGDQFPIHVRNKFRQLDVGSAITFYDIKVLLPSGYLETIAIQTYYLDDVEGK